MTTLSNIYTSLDSGYSWSGSYGQAASVTYSFNGLWSAVSTGDYDGAVSELSASDQASVEAILQLYANVANITFTEQSSGDGDIAFRNEYIQGGVDGYAYFPFSGIGGNVTLDSELGQITANSSAFYAAIHETGHALGFKHPFSDTGGPDVPVSGGIPASELTSEYSVMAYNGQPTDIVGPQLYDIATLQYIYGANSSYNAGDTNYSFTSTGATQAYALWDGAGTDTLNASDISTASTIDLREGDYLNSIGVEEFRIVYNANIENVIAGSGNDSVIGNGLVNWLYGGGGDDTIHAGKDNDVIISGSAVSDSNDGSDTAYGDLGSDIIYGNSGNDTLYGGRSISDADDGNDSIYGGLGDDIIYGNAGDDFIVGAAGNDSIYGGLGDDTFRITSNNQSDTIYGFESAGVAGGDIIELFSNMNGTDIDTFAELMAVSSTDGTHSWLATGGGNGVLVLYNTLSDFSANDFNFIAG